MADMHRAGRIGGDVLDIDPLAGAERGSAVGLPLRQHLAETALPESRREPQVDEARPGDIDGRHVGMRAQPAGQELGDLARLARRRLGQHEGRVGRDVAVAGIARRLDRETAFEHGTGQRASRHQLLQCFGNLV
jgi:hypothetical protein